MCIWYLYFGELEYHMYFGGTLQLRSLSSPSEIAHNEDIIRIFLMACEVKTVKLSVIGLSCMQKLISHDAVAPSALKEILNTLKDVSKFRFFLCIRTAKRFSLCNGLFQIQKYLKYFLFLICNVIFAMLICVPVPC